MNFFHSLEKRILFFQSLEERTPTDIYEYLLGFLDIDSRIRCGVIKRMDNSKFNLVYTKMSERRVIATIPSFYHIGGIQVHNGVEMCLHIENTKKLLMENSKYHTCIGILDDTYEEIYSEIHFWDQKKSQPTDYNGFNNDPLIFVNE